MMTAGTEMEEAGVRGVEYARGWRAYEAGGLRFEMQRRRRRQVARWDWQALLDGVAVAEGSTPALVDAWRQMATVLAWTAGFGPPGTPK